MSGLVQLRYYRPRVYGIGQEPCPDLRMFSAKFVSLQFPVNLYRGPSQVCNDHSPLRAFCPQGGHRKIYSDLKLGIFKYCVTVTSEIDVEAPYLAESISR